MCMGVYRQTAVIRHPSLGGNGTNTWHMRTIGPTEGDDVSQLEGAQTAIDAFYSAMLGLYADGTTIDADGSWFQVDEEGPTLLAPAWSAGPGSADDPLPPGCCVVVGWGTSIPGRNRRGRTFLGPFGRDSEADDGTPSAITLGVVRTAAQALVDDSVGFGDGALGVWSANSVVQPPAFYDFTRMAVANRYAYLRSRRD